MTISASYTTPWDSISVDVGTSVTASGDVNGSVYFYFFVPDGNGGYTMAASGQGSADSVTISPYLSTPAPVPLPASGGLLAAVLAALRWLTRRRRWGRVPA